VCVAAPAQRAGAVLRGTMSRACMAMAISAEPPKTRLMPTRIPMAQVGQPGEDDGGQDQVDDAADRCHRKGIPLRSTPRGSPHRCLRGVDAWGAAAVGY
jgi:hypothetical protein